MGIVEAVIKGTIIVVTISFAAYCVAGIVSNIRHRKGARGY